MKTFELTKKQLINSSMENVFDFFSKPENLKTITPEKLSFNILTPTPINMGKGTVIDYTIKFRALAYCWTDTKNQKNKYKLKVSELLTPIKRFPMSQTSF